MDWLSFPQGELKGFILKVQDKLDISIDELGKLIKISPRTLRDWKREKYKPSQELITKLSEFSGIKLPVHKVVLQREHISEAAKLGGKRRYELHGPPGTKEGRSKGGKSSWLKRKSNPDLWRKYTKDILEPEESVELAEFMGIMLGDGGLTSFQCSVYLNSETDQEFAYYVRDLATKLFGVTPKIYMHKKYKVWRVSISSVNLVKYLTLKGLCLGNKMRLQVSVPSWVRSEQGYIKACIRGLIDTDGSFIIHRYKVKGKEYSYPRLSFSNRSEPLLDFVYKGLKQLGFNSKIKKDEVCLYRQDEVLRYLEVIGVRNLRPNVKKIRWVARVV